MDHSEINRLKTELAEAVALLRYAMESSSFREILTLERDIAAFLARHAQAEQQEVCWQCGGIGEVDTGGVMPWGAPAMAKCPCQREDQAEQQDAHGAQAGDERAAFERWAKDRSWFDPKPSTKERDDSLFFYEDAITDHNWIAWQARAALATKPASGEPVDGVEGFACWLIDHCEGYEIFEEKIQEWVAGYLKSEAYQRVAAPPAAAHGDEAVLWELLEELRTATDRQALPGEFIRVMWEAGCDWINARAAMRAQGDGESV